MNLINKNNNSIIMNEDVVSSRIVYMCRDDRKSVTNLREVNKKFKKIVDLDEKLYYNSQILKLKNCFYFIGDVTNKISICQKLIADLTTKKSDKVNELSLISTGIIGNFTTKHHGLRSLILDTFSMVSTSASQSIELCKKTKRDLELEIESLDKEIQGYNMETLEKQAEDLKTRFDSLNTKVKEEERVEKNSREIATKYERQMIILGLGPKEDQTIFKKMMSLFGGIEQYEALPVLNLTDRNIGKDFRELKVVDLTAPIMKGITADGRNFFVLRCENSNNDLYRSIISQYSDGNYNTWVGRGNPDLIEFGTFIDEGKTCEEAFNHLAEVIKTGKNGDYIVQ